MSDEVPDFSNENYRIPDSTTYAAIGTLIGMVAVFTLVIASFVTPDASGMDSARSISDFIVLAGKYHQQITFITIMDTIFIAGYTSLFVGLWLLVRDFSEVLSKVGLVTGLLVGLFDLIENSILLVVVNGLQIGWQPDARIFGLLFVLNTFIDLLSYTAGTIFAVIFLAIYKPFDRRFILGILLTCYVLIGLSSFLFPAMLLVRSVFFIIGLMVGGGILWKEEDIPTELLEKIIEQQKANKNDFIR